MEKEYEKIAKFLSPEEFSWVIMNFFSHKELASFMERMGFNYSGARTTTIPRSKLSLDLACEAIKDKEVAKVLIKKFESINYLELEEIGSLKESEIGSYLKENAREFYLERKIGKIVWALLADVRQEINNEIPKFIEGIEELADEAERSQIAREVEKEVVEKRDRKWFKGALEKLKRKNKLIDESNKFLVKENKKFKQRANTFHKKNKELEKKLAFINQQKGILNKSIQRKDEQIKKLEEENKVMGEELKSHPARMLKSSLHHLGKETEKLSYELEKEREQNAKKLLELKREVSFLTTQVVERNQKVEVLRQSLEEADKRGLNLELELKEKRAKEDTHLQVYPHKGERVGIFVDVQNIYYSAKRLFNKKADYNKLLSYLVGKRHLVKAICYIVQTPELSQESFINMLKKIGYTVRTRDLIRRADGSAKGNWDIGMAVDILYMIEKNSLDIVVLVTCDGDFTDLVKVLKSKGIKTEVAGFPKITALDLKRFSDEFILIEEDLML
ncbi:MAG: NYN domain-containing protein [Candidatus Omnitrophica bacterium]|nr:NYN domain-containing protein [Candidatus Omnitrophota bacterium]MBU1134836.1 NYN domain-containing protein [Candidatus Omnitrophota bacterium]MBU1810733.1 NYN domain-containing protein [Candidatus Omnitrophota bacterium]